MTLRRELTIVCYWGSGELCEVEAMLSQGQVEGAQDMESVAVGITRRDSLIIYSLCSMLRDFSIMPSLDYVSDTTIIGRKRLYSSKNQH